MPDTDSTKSTPNSQTDPDSSTDKSSQTDTAESVNESTSTANAGNDLSEDQKGALAAGVANPDSDASLTD